MPLAAALGPAVQLQAGKRVGVLHADLHLLTGGCPLLGRAVVGAAQRTALQVARDDCCCALMVNCSGQILQRL